jgi:hypothetical protein
VGIEHPKSYLLHFTGAFVDRLVFLVLAIGSAVPGAASSHVMCYHPLKLEICSSEGHVSSKYLGCHLRRGIEASVASKTLLGISQDADMSPVVLTRTLW